MKHVVIAVLCAALLLSSHLASRAGQGVMMHGTIATALVCTPNYPAGKTSFAVPVTPGTVVATCTPQPVGWSGVVDIDPSVDGSAFSLVASPTASSGAAVAIIVGAAPLTTAKVYTFNINTNPGVPTQLNITVGSTSPPSGSTPAITVNGAASGASVAAGSSVTVAASGGPANPLDWVGLCTSNSTCGVNSGDYSDYAFLANCSKTHPTTGVSSGSCSLKAFSVSGNYYANFFPNNASSGPLATASFTVTGGGGGGGPPPGGGGGGGAGSILPPGNWTNVFDYEFNGSGAPSAIAYGASTGTSAQGIDWTQWSITGGEGGNQGSYAFAGPNTALTHCSNTLWESGGSLHITTYGTVGVNGQSVANPSYGCEIKHLANWQGSAMYFEQRTNQDNNMNPAGWSSLGWLCCGNDNVFGGAGWEVDVMEVNSGGNPDNTYGGAVFYNNYAGVQQIIGVQGQPTGWHITGTLMSKTSGVTLYVDGVNMGTGNPWGCSSSTPCTFSESNYRFSNALHNNSSLAPSSVGVLIDWARIYYQ